MFAGNKVTVCYALTYVPRWQNTFSVPGMASTLFQTGLPWLMSLTYDRGGT